MALWRYLTAPAAACWFFWVPAAVAEWPQWRGPERDGVIPKELVPSEWPKRLERRWSVEVGTGHSSPVVSDGRVCLLARQSGHEVAACFAVADGKRLWEDRYAAPYEMNSAAVSHGCGPKSTPLIHARRLYTFGISGILSAYRLEDGRLLWRKEFSREYRRTSPLYGAAMSPIAADGLLLAHVGGHNDGALTAFDAASGKVQWQWSGDGPGYASPVLATFGGVRQVITETQDAIVGIALEDGRQLWQIPLKTPYYQNAVTPLVFEDLLILSGHQQSAFAIRVRRDGSNWKTEKVWDNRAISMYMSSPVVHDGLLFGFTEKRRGTMFCADARTGKVRWMGPGREGANAAVLLAGDDLLVLTTDAELIVVPARGESYGPAARYKVAETPTWASPALADEGILIKDAETLALWTAPGGRR